MDFEWIIIIFSLKIMDENGLYLILKCNYNRLFYEIQLRISESHPTKAESVKLTTMVIFCLC